MENQRVVITGVGLICSIGNNISEFTSNLKNGVHGLKNIHEDRFSTQHQVYKCNKGCVIDSEIFNTIKNEDITVLKKASKIAILEALTNANLDLSISSDEIIGISMGTSVGASYSFMEFVKQSINDEIDNNHELLYNTAPTIAGSLAKEFNLNGPITTISTACASGTNSIGRAFDYITNNRADIMISGGVDIFTELTYSGFNSLQALALENCKPFDKYRDGLNLGDAAAFLILESYQHAVSRNAKILAEVMGYSILNEAYHSAAPSPSGDVAYNCMKIALKEANIFPEEVDYINAHGTGTKANDEMEIKAIGKLFENVNKKVFISSTKSLVGHTLGAAGSIELIATVIGIEEGFIPPSINVSNSIIENEKIILVNGKAVNADIKVAISNSFGFAGNIASIVVKKYSN